MSDVTPTPRRKPIPKRVRFEVLKRDGHRCRYCGATAEDEKLTVDHVIPVVLGGSDDPSNLATACAPCNSGKSSSNPDDALVADVSETQMEFAKALRLAYLFRKYDRRGTESDTADWFEDWKGYKIERTGAMLPLPLGWDISIERFLCSGLDIDDLTKATKIAMAGPARGDAVFGYFCGVCWNWIKESQNVAKQLVDQGVDNFDWLLEEDIL